MDPLTSTTTNESAAKGRVAFITGRLAAESLRSVLAQAAPELPFRYEVITLNIAVAALLSADWVAKKLELPGGIERIVLPGYLSGDIERLSRHLGLPCERGPKDLRDIPERYGARSREREGYGERTIEIVAEINHVPRLSSEAVLEEALRLRGDGADVIDLGCDPGPPFSGVRALTRKLKEAGLSVSIDSLEPEEIVPALEEGAALVLSVNATNLDAILPALRSHAAEAVVIPDSPSSLEGLRRSVDRLQDAGLRLRIDPILEPIGFGFASSLGRCLQVRRDYPDAEMLLGVGNITELTDADSAAINLLLAAFCEEVGIRSVLTTQVIHWARNSVRELDIARRLTRYSVARRRLPKHIEGDLHIVRDPRLRVHGREAIDRIAAGLRDKSIRIFAEEGLLHLMRAGLHVSGTDPFELFPRLGVQDPSHAFYLGYELAKAVTALTLSKSYVQDEALRWGYLTREERVHERDAAREDSSGEESDREATP